MCRKAPPRVGSCWACESITQQGRGWQEAAAAARAPAPTSPNHARDARQRGELCGKGQAHQGIHLGMRMTGSSLQQGLAAHKHPAALHPQPASSRGTAAAARARGHPP